jgi:hypothetical protein
MARDQVPAATLASPDSIDAQTWVLLHMTTTGLIVNVADRGGLANGWSGRVVTNERHEIVAGAEAARPGCAPLLAEAGCHVPTVAAATAPEDP